MIARRRRNSYPQKKKEEKVSRRHLTFVCKRFHNWFKFAMPIAETECFLVFFKDDSQKYESIRHFLVLASSNELQKFREIIKTNSKTKYVISKRKRMKTVENAASTNHCSINLQIDQNLQFNLSNNPKTSPSYLHPPKLRSQPLIKLMAPSALKKAIQHKKFISLCESS